MFECCRSMADMRLGVGTGDEVLQNTLGSY